MPRGLFSPRRMKRVWASAEQGEIARLAKASKQRKEAGVQKGVRANRDDERAKRELEKYWQSIRDKQGGRSAEEQRRRIESATGVHRRPAERVERPKPAEASVLAELYRRFPQKGAEGQAQKSASA